MVLAFFDLATSIWLHTGIITSLIPAIVVIRANRAVIPVIGGSKFVGFVLAFVVWVIWVVFLGAVGQPVIENFLTNALGSASNPTPSIGDLAPLDLANGLLFFLEYVVFVWSAESKSSP
jgi:hypothetical protein